VDLASYFYLDRKRGKSLVSKHQHLTCLVEALLAALCNIVARGDFASQAPQPVTRWPRTTLTLANQTLCRVRRGHAMSSVSTSRVATAMMQEQTFRPLGSLLVGQWTCQPACRCFDPFPDRRRHCCLCERKKSTGPQCTLPAVLLFAAAPRRPLALHHNTSKSSNKATGTVGAPYDFA
jgi:hypothetical protein